MAIFNGINPSSLGAALIKRCPVCNQNTQPFINSKLKASLPFGSAGTAIGVSSTTDADPEEVVPISCMICPVCGYIMDFTSPVVPTQIPSYGEDNIPAGTTITVSNLEHLYTAALKGSTYTPPSQVKAFLSNGDYILVTVTWTGTIDTSTVGIKTIEGTMTNNSQIINGDNSKPSLTVVVSDVTPTLLYLIIPNDTCNKGQSYTLPTQVSGYYSDGNVRAVPIGIATQQSNVGWSIATVDTSVAGTQTITGTIIIDSITYTASYTLTVV